MTPDFEQNFKAGKTQLLTKTLSADLNTPVTAYLKVCENKPYSFLLESVEGGQRMGRYSILGCDPDLIIQPKNTADLREALQSCKIDVVPDGLPPMAVSGLFGYLGYDTIRFAEDIPDTNPDDLNIPESILIRPRLLIIFDNVKSQIFLIAPVYETTGDAQSIYEKTNTLLETALIKLKAEIPTYLLSSQTGLTLPLSITSNMAEDAYKSAVSKAVEYIHQGEIFQVVLSQRFSADFDLPAFSLYRSLRQLNPSPFLFHINLDGFSLVGSSPEVLVRVRDNTVTIRPIAGTRPRGANEIEDKAHEKDLLADEKELSEHLMLLDLGRNDVGRVSEFGSVKVTARNTIEKYSHVMHIVSNVEGTLRKDKDIIDALFSGFPAGTVSGAPKIRAMEIIDELETSKRSYYAGCIGYLSPCGTMDTCIALRTGLIKDGKLYVQAGAGIVADSNPTSEHQECINKSMALFHAAELALKQANS